MKPRSSICLQRAEPTYAGHNQRHTFLINFRKSFLFRSSGGEIGRTEDPRVGSSILSPGTAKALYMEMEPLRKSEELIMRFSTTGLPDLAMALASAMVSLILLVSSSKRPLAP